MEKKFKCKDEVIYRSKIEYGNHHWTYGIFSHYEYHQDVTFASLGCLSLNINDWEILPYEGNEHLVGSQDSPSLEISNQAKLLFTLTAEEVEELEEPIQYFAKKLNKGWLIEEGGAYIPPDSWDKAINNLLTRIKQWQDENRP